MIISIELAREFPVSAPILRCKYERHMYIDSSTYVIMKSAHPGLEVWEQGNDLGVILSDLYNNVFLRTPPTPMAPNWDSSYNNPLAQPLESIKDNAILNRLIDSADPVAPNAAPQPSASQSNLAPATELSMADFKKALESKNMKELEEISQDPHSFLAQWSRLAPIRDRAAKRMSQTESTRKLQEEVPKLEAELEELENVNQVLLAGKAELESQLQSLSNDLRSYEDAYTKRAVSDKLLSMAQHEELRSDDMATAFYREMPDPESGQKLDLDTFTKQFIASRQLYRLRLAKMGYLLSSPDVPSTLASSSSNGSAASILPFRSNTTTSSNVSSPPPSFLSSRPY